MHCVTPSTVLDEPRQERGAAPDDGDIELAITCLDVGAGELRAAAALLSDAERERAARFAFQHDCRRYIVARARLRELLGARLAVQPQAVEFSYGPHGKPALAPRFADSALCFNVSHCEDVAVHALAVGREVGVDVEVVRALPDADAIAARFFSPRESEAYRALDPHHRPAGFFNCWTRKEAFVKALGDGLAYPLNRFDVSLAPGARARILRVGNTPGERCGWALQSFAPGPGVVGAVVFRASRTLQ